MKIQEILPESWWKDLDDNSLSMIGHEGNDDVEEIPDNASLVSHMAAQIRDQY